MRTERIGRAHFRDAASVRLHAVHYHRSTPRPEEWCLIEWPQARRSRRNVVLSQFGPENIS